ncbi:MAG: hypothetical protein ACE5FA_08390 [Dehalococcoidia bacterium]
MFSIAPIHLATRVLPAAILLTATAVFVLFVVQDSADREPLMLTGVYMPDIERGFQHFLTPSNNDQPQITPSDAREGAERKIPSDWIQDPEVREIKLALLVSDDGP